jgi:hypothetical protein
MEIRETSFGPLDEVGFYELNNASGDWLSGSSLLSATETLIGNAEVKETATSINRGTSPMAWLTLLAIAVLAGESILYQRRKVG